MAKFKLEFCADAPSDECEKVRLVAGTAQFTLEFEADENVDMFSRYDEALSDIKRYGFKDFRLLLFKEGDPLGMPIIAAACGTYSFPRG